MNFIERDPDEMLKFADSAEKYVNNVVPIIRHLQGSIEYYKEELDDNCQVCIEKLNADCELFLTQVDVYHELANQIKKKATKQKDIKPRY